MRVSKLEELSTRLHQLRNRLDATPLSKDTPLDGSNVLVQAAWECEFMLPERLTVGSLAETVDRKIANVKMLLERARTHEDLPAEAQAAAESGYTVNEEDVANTHGRNANNGNSSAPS